MIVCYESDVLFVAGLSIGLWVATMVGMGCAMFSMKKRSYADQIEELMFEHIVKQLHEIDLTEAFEQSDVEEEQEQEQEQEDSEEEQEQESDAESEQEEEESEESNDADNEQEQDIEYVETQTEYNDLPDLVEEPLAPVESPSESSDDMAPPSKRARRGRGRGRGHRNT
jgi:TATA-binding protein-associated factor Taf7